MRPLTLQGIFLDPRVKEAPICAKILDRQRWVPVRLVSSPPLPKGDPFDFGKRRLFMTLGEGRALRPCPGTKRYICCGYQILHLGSGCPFDCTYCILQVYLSNPYLTVFTNAPEIIKQAKREITAQRNRFFRIGTGEFMDSLGLEPITELAPLLVETFSDLDNACLELKTKSVFIDHLLQLPHQKRTFLSWSLNSPEISESEEKGTPSLKERLQAAVRAAEAGYPLGFHFDPLIYYPGWQKGYQKTLVLLKDYLAGATVAWISLGALRFMPSLKAVARKRHPESRIFLGEFILGLDGKMRYLRPIRVEMYRRLYAELKEIFPETTIYLCMESELVWREALGINPQQAGGLSQMLDNAARRVIYA